METTVNTSRATSTGRPNLTQAQTAISYQRKVMNFWVDLANKQDLKVKADLDRLKSTNSALHAVNMVIAELSKLHALVKDDGDSKRLRGELQKQPDLQLKINNLLKLAGLSSPAFDGNIRVPSGRDTGTSSAQENESLDYLINDADFLKKVGETAIGQSRNLDGVNNLFIARVPGIAAGSVITPSQSSELIEKLTNKTIPAEPIPETVEDAIASGWAMPVPKRNIEINLGFHKITLANPHYDGEKNFQEKYTKIMYIEIKKRNNYTLVGGLSDSMNGLDLNKSVRRLQAEATSKSNELQSNSITSSRSIGLMNSISEGFKSYIDKLNQDINQITSRY